MLFFKQIHKIFAIILLIPVVFACSSDAEYDKKKAISVFATSHDLKIDDNLKNIAIKLPKQLKNSSWTATIAQKNQEIENLAKIFNYNDDKELILDESTIYWSFYSGSLSDRFVFKPIIKDNKAFILRNNGVLVAYDLQQDKIIFKKRLFAKKFLKNYQNPKIGNFNNRIFAIAGINKIVAASEVDGAILWSKTIAAVPISTPVSDGNLVYVSTNDNKIYAFDFNNGKLQWIQSGISRPTAIFGAADLVIYNDLLIAGYSSGEIYALNKKTGEVSWFNDLNISRAINSDFYLNDIDATPLVKDNIIYAIGNGGLMMAMNIADGKYLWKRKISGLANFWLAGDFLFVINNNNQLLAIYKKTGAIKWLKQLPHFEDDEEPETKFIYNSVIMVGDKLVISRFDGKILIASPFDGKVEKTFNIAKKIFHTPLIINDKIYIYNLGRFTASLVAIK